MPTHRDPNQVPTSVKQRGFYAGLKRRLPGTGDFDRQDPTRRPRRYQLIRQERVIVGPSTAPFPIHHETTISSSDSLAEMLELRDRMRGGTSGTTVQVFEPASWVDSIPGEKAFTYTIRKR